MPKKAQFHSVADANAAPSGAASVDKALSLLSAFRAGDASLTLAELAERSQLYKSTVLRSLASLAHAGYVQRLPDGRYALGSEIARLSAVYAASFSLDRIVLPVLQVLSEDPYGIFCLVLTPTRYGGAPGVPCLTSGAPTSPA